MINEHTPSIMLEKLKINNDFFKNILNDIDEEEHFTNEPYFYSQSYDGEDYYDELIDTEQYLKDYCSNKNLIHRFTNNLHFEYNEDEDDLRIYHIFHFNTSEYGVPREYVEDQLHDSDADWVSIKSDRFETPNGIFPMGSTEEEMFQLSCTDLGYYIDVLKQAKDFYFQEIHDERS